jgi:shikimate dehydrogenase
MKVFGIISDERVYRSRSPALFTAVFQRMGIKASYVPLMVKSENLGQAVHSLRWLHLAGANVTAPYKEEVVGYLDSLSEGANIIGAVNTIVRSGDQLKGYNTNAIGFMDALGQLGYEVEGKAVIVLGTGGAAKAAVFILNWLRTDAVLVTGRNPEKADAIARRFGGHALNLDTLATTPLPVHLIVNATSVSNAEESPSFAATIDAIRTNGCELVFDLNYGRPNNCWQALAQRIGARFSDGLIALAYQARRTLALWTGLQIAPEVFLDTIRDKNLV